MNNMPGKIDDKTLCALYEVFPHQRNPLVQFHLQNLSLARDLGIG